MSLYSKADLSEGKSREQSTNAGTSKTSLLRHNAGFSFKLNLIPSFPEVLHQSVILLVPNMWNAYLKTEFTLRSISWSVGATIKSLIVKTQQSSIFSLPYKDIIPSVTFLAFQINTEMFRNTKYKQVPFLKQSREPLVSSGIAKFHSDALKEFLMEEMVITCSFL